MKTIMMILFGVILYLNGGEKIEFQGPCFPIGGQHGQPMVSVYCSDWKIRGLLNPIAFSIQPAAIEKIIQYPDSKTREGLKN